MPDLGPLTSWSLGTEVRSSHFRVSGAYKELSHLSLLLSPSPLSVMLGSDKHFLNSPTTLVVDSLKGLCAANPNLKLDATNKGGCGLNATPCTSFQLMRF